MTEVGTLEIWADSKESDHRWRLQFELRKTAEQTSAKPAAVVSEEAVAAAEELIGRTFELDANENGAIEPAQLPARLEQTLALGRSSWPLSAIRRLADRFLAVAAGTSAAPRMNSAG